MMEYPHCGHTVYNFACESCYERLTEERDRLLLLAKTNAEDMARLENERDALKAELEGNNLFHALKEEQVKSDRLTQENKRLRSELATCTQWSGRAELLVEIDAWKQIAQKVKDILSQEANSRWKVDEALAQFPADEGKP
jgi:hypothetical protein